MNISTTIELIATKFYLKHYWGGEKAALGFGPDQIGAVVSIAMDSSHRVIMGKHCDHSSAPIFDGIFFILSGKKDNHKVWTEFEILEDRTKGCGVSCP